GRAGAAPLAEGAPRVRETAERRWLPRRAEALRSGRAHDGPFERDRERRRRPSGQSQPPQGRVVVHGEVAVEPGNLGLVGEAEAAGEALVDLVLAVGTG